LNYDRKKPKLLKGQAANQSSVLSTVSMVKDTDTQRSHGLFYALGGGRGHVTRALNLARRFRRATILHSSDGSYGELPAGIRLIRLNPTDDANSVIEEQKTERTIVVVDTFPWGIRHELNPSVLGRFNPRILVARFVSPGSYARYDEGLEYYTDIWLPTSPNDCEWEGLVSGHYIGPQARHIDIESKQQAACVVIGDRTVLPDSYRRKLPKETVFIEGPFQRLPTSQRVLSLGAGYNIVHELQALGVEAAFVPQDRRYDNQFIRARRLGRCISSSEDLEAWLEPVPDSALEAR
jgi:hypothetical protein